MYFISTRDYVLLLQSLHKLKLRYWHIYYMCAIGNWYNIVCMNNWFKPLTSLQLTVGLTRLFNMWSFSDNINKLCASIPCTTYCLVRPPIHGKPKYSLPPHTAKLFETSEPPIFYITRDESIILQIAFYSSTRWIQRFLSYWHFCFEG